MTDDNHSLDAHPMGEWMEEEELAQLKRDVQLCRVSWPICVIKLGETMIVNGQDYAAFVDHKSQQHTDHGHEPDFLPDCMFGFQSHLTEWAVRKGRAAILADCGLGKTLMELVWAQNVLNHTGRPVLILTPLAVAQQTEAEARKFGIDARRSKDGEHSGGIVITNYERLHHFDSSDFGAVVCDESSILKSYAGKRRKLITAFMRKMDYRLLGTATAAPNDYIELGTSSEALGEITHSEMLRRFFRQLDDKGQKRETKQQEEAELLLEADPSYFQKLAYRVAQTIGQWRLRHHAVKPFWRWVASWARACRRPSDLGFPDDGFELPALEVIDHLVECCPAPGMLFHVPAYGMQAERGERRRTLRQRCEYVRDLVDHDRPAVIWCHYNPEGDLLEKMIPGAVQVAGRTPDDEKERIYAAFSDGSQRVVVIKPKIGAWGLNWQHCNHIVTFPSHSYEQYYQSIRRCWRFGQDRPVRVDVVTTEAEARVIGNMRKKAEKADRMFTELAAQMHDAETIARGEGFTNSQEVPSWL